MFYSTMFIAKEKESFIQLLNSLQLLSYFSSTNNIACQPSQLWPAFSLSPVKVEIFTLYSFYLTTFFTPCRKGKKYNSQITFFSNFTEDVSFYNSNNRA